MAQTLKFGNGTWATKKGSTLAYSDTNNAFKPLPFTYSGPGKGTRVNKEGLIEVVENDRPRIDYKDSEDGVFLLEKAATNFVTHSEDFSNGSWVKSGASVTSGFVSPDGTANAFKLVEDTNNGNHRIFGSALASNIYTISIFAKYNGRLLQLASTTSVGHYANFDLLNGVIGNYGSLTENPTIIELTNGWYKCSMTTTSNMNTPIVSAIQSTTSAYQPDEQGDGTSGIYIWGAMLEQNSQASSYIPTQGTIQTRVQETANGSGNSEVFSDSQGSLFLNINTSDTSAVPVISLSNGSFSNEIEFAYYGTNQFNFILRVSGGTPNVVGNIVGNSFSKFCVTYTTTDFKVYLNGFLIGSNTLPSPLSGLNVLDFNLPNGLNNFYGKTKEISYYDEILTDLELETLTSYRTWEEMVKELNLNIIHNE